jgi:hypothetical protein
VRGVFAAATVLLPLSGAFCGCAGIAGLTAFSDGDCSGGNCGASVDAGVEVGTGVEVGAGDGAPGLDGSGVNDATDDGSLSQDVVVADAVHDTASGDAVVSCNTTSCPSGCTTHSDGLGQNYTDCNPLYSSNNPWTETAALEACDAFTGDSSKCTTGWKCGGSFSVCSSGQMVCDCWDYSGASAGHVNASGNCDCVQSSDPGWD